MAIVGLLMLVGGMNLYDAKNRNEVLNCAKRMASDIKMARRRSQGSGGRIVFMTSFDPSINNDQGPVDLDGVADPTTSQLTDEYYIIFLDDFAYGGYTKSSDTPVILSGTPGDPLCDGNIVFKKESTLASNALVDDGLGTIDVTPWGMLFFSSQGALLNFGAVDKNLYLENRGQVARLQVIGLTGATRIYLNQPGYENCDDGDCAVGTTDSTGHNPNWQPIQNTL
jgi:hypothetical protein